MAIAGSLTYDTKIDTSGFQKGLNKLSNSASSGAKSASSSLNSINKEINKIENNTNNASSGLGKFSAGLGKIGSVGGAAFGAVAAGVGAATAAIGALTASSIKAYAEYEQLVGGVDTLFKNSSSKVQQYASEAYKTAGISANRYMETVTGFSAKLLQGLGGDTEKAADMADLAIRDMSDNANKMGTSMEVIIDTYQSLARGNYEMLDNLKLGYGGTQTEMARLINDSGVLGDTMTATAENVNQISFDKFIEAIHVVQDNMDITGTTAKEAETTISGSLNSMKASWENLLVGISNSEGDIDGLMDTLTDNITTFAGNILPVLGTALANIPKLIEKMLPTFIDAIPGLINDLLPQIVNSGIAIVQGLIDGMTQNIEIIGLGVMQIITSIVSAFIMMLPQIISLGMQLIVQLALGIAQAIPQLIPQIINVVIQIVNTLIENLPMLIQAALQLILALAQGLLQALPQLIAQIPVIIENLYSALTDPAMIAMIIQAAIQLIIALAGGLIQALPQLVTMAPRVIAAIFKALKDNITKTNWLKLGKDILKGILNGLLDFGNVVKNTIKKVGKKITNEIKDFFGIESPSKLMKEEVGKYLPSGIAVGIEANTDSVLKSIDAMDKEINTKMKRAVALETGNINAQAKINSAVANNSIIQINATFDGNVEMDKNKIGRIITPVVTKTIKVGGIR